MQLHTPQPYPKPDGEFEVRFNDYNYDAPFAAIVLSDDYRTRLILESEDDCDRIIKAACKAKDLFRAARHGKPAPLPAGARLTPPGYQPPAAIMTDGAR